MTKEKALLFNISSMLCWSVSPILIRLVSGSFSVSFQNLYRYAVSILILWIFTLAAYGKSGIRDSFRKIHRPLPKFVLIAFCNYIHQYFLIKGVYLLFPGLVTLIEESVIIFTAVLAFVFIPSERNLIKNPVFPAGIALAVSGIILTVFPELHTECESSVAAGIASVLVSSLAWAFFSLLVRLWLPQTPAPVASSLIFTIVIAFFLFSVITGAGDLPSAATPAGDWLILTVSGIIGIGMGYSFYYVSIKGLGMTLTATLGLLIPVLTAIISFIVFGEVLRPVQIAGSVMLLGGCFIIVRKQFGS